MKKNPDPRRVFIIHGRNLEAKRSIEKFVISLGLTPLDFTDIAADLGGMVFVGDIVKEGMKQARGVISLFTPDEITFLRTEYYQRSDQDEDKQRWQSRPNVIFEAGMAYAIATERTILAVLGSDTKLFSDIGGVHLLYLDNKRESREHLRKKIMGAGCTINLDSEDWLDPCKSGDFESCNPSPIIITRPFCLDPIMDTTQSGMAEFMSGARDIYSAADKAQHLAFTQLLSGLCGPLKGRLTISCKKNLEYKIKYLENNRDGSSTGGVLKTTTGQISIAISSNNALKTLAVYFAAPQEAEEINFCWENEIGQTTEGRWP